MKLLTWNVNGLRSLPNFPQIFAEFSADIICLQETKISRNLLTENMALVDGFSSYFAFPKKQSGYSGVATYCSMKCTPGSAEDSLSDFEIFSGDVCPELPDTAVLQRADLTTLNDEGRAVITHHTIEHNEQKAVLSVINVYCPRVDPQKPERHLYKMKFCHLLGAKAKYLLKQGCHVVILGDLNIAHHVIDHCDPGDKEKFDVEEARQWLTSLVETHAMCSESLFVDAYRYLHPDENKAYTCWNTVTGARQTNYGTRIDYVIISRSLLPLLHSCEILSEVHGSDHCPVEAVLTCSTVPSATFPSMCSKYWPEFSGKQQTIMGFMSYAKSASSQSLCPSKKQTMQSDQRAITDFFKCNQFSNKSEKVNDNVRSGLTPCSRTDEKSVSSPLIGNVQDYEENTKVKLCKNKNKQKLVLQWKSVLSGPQKPPLCARHKKQCVLRSVRKKGPNFGRKFFACPQPVGPSSDPESNCSFFQWVYPEKRSSQERCCH